MRTAAIRLTALPPTHHTPEELRVNPLADLCNDLTRWFRRPPRIELVRGDITREHVHAIVNAAKPTLMGGGGVDGAIHKAGGPSILAQCRALRNLYYPDGVPVGEAAATTAGKMNAHWVIHTVGPRYSDTQDPTLLHSCYVKSLLTAERLGARSIAFPLISAGVYGWPTDEAIIAALSAMAAYRGKIKLIRLVLFDDRTLTLARQIRHAGAGNR